MSDRFVQVRRGCFPEINKKHDKWAPRGYSENLGGGVPLGLWNPYPVPPYPHSTPFCNLFYTRRQKTLPYPRLAIFQLSNRNITTKYFQCKTICRSTKLPWLNLHLFPSFSNPILDQIFRITYKFPGNWYPILEQDSLIFIPYPRPNCSKTVPFKVVHTYSCIGYIWVYPTLPGKLA